MFAPQLDQSIRHLFAGVYALSGSLLPSNDAQAVVRVLCAVRPAVPELVVAEALQAADMPARRLARQSLEAADMRFPGNALVKAGLTLILYALHDSLWQAYAEEVRQLPRDEVALGIVNWVDAAARNEPDAFAEAEEEPSPVSNEAAAAYLPYMQAGLAC